MTDPKQATELFHEQYPDHKAHHSWCWIPVRDEFSFRDDLAKAYIVVTFKEAASKVMVYALWGTSWDPNPWSTRPVIRALMKLANLPGTPETNGNCFNYTPQ